MSEAAGSEGAVAAERVSWHDAVVEAVRLDPVAGTATWEVDLAAWALEEAATAASGVPVLVRAPNPGRRSDRLVFVGLETVDARHDLEGVPPDGRLPWDVLDAHWEHDGRALRGRFRLSLPRVKNARGGSGYAELDIVCREAWVLPGGGPPEGPG